MNPVTALALGKSSSKAGLYVRRIYYYDVEVISPSKWAWNAFNL